LPRHALLRAAFAGRRGVLGAPPALRAGSGCRRRRVATAAGRKCLLNFLSSKAILSHLDDDLAFCTSFFDVSQSLFGRCEWKDPIHHWAYDPSIDESTDLA
jgi:hypothetical protein